MILNKNYQKYNKMYLHIILFFKGMDTIETLEPSAFVEYLKTFSNTICGRHPISVLLQVKSL